MTVAWMTSLTRPTSRRTVRAARNSWSVSPAVVVTAAAVPWWVSTRACSRALMVVVNGVARRNATRVANAAPACSTLAGEVWSSSASGVGGDTGGAWGLGVLVGRPNRANCSRAVREVKAVRLIPSTTAKACLTGNRTPPTCTQCVWIGSGATSRSRSTAVASSRSNCSQLTVSRMVTTPDKRSAPGGTQPEIAASPCVRDRHGRFHMTRSWCGASAQAAPTRSRQCSPHRWPRHGGRTAEPANPAPHRYLHLDRRRWLHMPQDA